MVLIFVTLISSEDTNKLQATLKSGFLTGEDGTGLISNVNNQLSQFWMNIIFNMGLSPVNSVIHELISTKPEQLTRWLL
jgi:hypothetical protein